MTEPSVSQDREHDPVARPDVEAIERRPQAGLITSARDVLALCAYVRALEQQIEFWKGSHTPIIQPYLERALKAEADAEELQGYVTELRESDEANYKRAAALKAERDTLAARVQTLEQQVMQLQVFLEQAREPTEDAD